MIKKLRWKFVFVTTAFSMAVLCIVLWFSFAMMKNNIEQENKETMQQIAEMQQIPIMGFPRFQTEYIRVPYFMVDVSQSGYVSNLQSNYMEINTEVDEELLLDLVAAALSSKENTGILADDSLRFYRKAKLNGWRLVYLDMTMENNTLQNLMGNMTLIGLGSFVGIFLLSMGLAYWITKPVERAWNQQRQFVADASHELKTPLTVILSNTDMLLEHGLTVDENTKRRLGNIRAESVRMKDLVEDMLDLARSDAGKSKQSLTTVSISDTVMDSVLLFEALVFEKQKELQYQIEENLTVLSNENRMKQLIGILLDNAMKYSSEQGCIWVKLEKNTAKTLRLMVANTGETLTQEQCRRIFERFYRTDPARQNNGGYGLGLSIASSIVSEMNGKIWCESRSGVNSFFVQLPLFKEETKNLQMMK